MHPPRGGRVTGRVSVWGQAGAVPAGVRRGDPFLESSPSYQTGFNTISNLCFMALYKITGWLFVVTLLKYWILMTGHSTLGAESAHCGPDTPKIYSVEMEDDHTYHKMKMHDNTIHHMVYICFTIVSFALMWIQSKIIVITLSVVSIDCSVFILSYRFGLAVQSGVSGPQGADSAPSVLWEVHSKKRRLLFIPA